MSKRFVNFKSKTMKVAITLALVGTTTLGAHGASMEAVTTANLNMRTGEGTNHKIVTTVKKGERVQILEDEGSWWKVRYGNKEGYSSKKYLRVSNNKPVQQEGTINVGNSRLNVRSGAGTNYKVLGKLNSGITIKITGQKGSWYEINYKGDVAFVYKDYVKNVHNVGTGNDSTQVNKVMKVNVGSSRLNVRSGAGTNYKVLGKLSNGTTVNVIEKTSNGWYKIEFNGGHGFVSAGYLTEVHSIPGTAINQVPRITAKEDLVLKVGDTFSNDLLEIKATDAEEGDLTSKVKVEGTVDTTQAGSYELVLTVEDSKGAETVKRVTVKVNPVMSLINSVPTITATEEITIEEGTAFSLDLLDIVAEDKEDGILTDKVVVEGDVDTDQPGEYTITLKVTDSKGASTTKVVKVIVEIKDTNTAPIITSVDNLSINIKASFNNSMLKASATDKDGDEVTLEYSGTVNTNKVGTYKITLTATDSKGAKTTKIVDVKVRPVRPTISGSHIVIDKGNTFNNSMLNAIATDCEGKALTVEYSGTINTNKIGMQYITISTTDEWGLSSNTVIQVEVKDK